jgi:small subunit ribosomal protein S20
MAHSKANKKHMIVSAKKNILNRAARSRIRTAIKTVTEAKVKETAVTALKNVYSVLDKNVKSGILHKNNAARKKSRLAKMTAKVSA